MDNNTPSISSPSPSNEPPRLADHFVFQNSLLLILGSAAGLIWANLGHASYEHFIHFKILSNPWIGTPQIGAVPNGAHVIDLHYLVNDLLMALFFAIAGKEVWEALLPDGPLHEPRKAATPLIATLGGMIGPTAVYLLGAAALGKFADYSHGWAIPCATDIAFSYLLARFIFGASHPALPFLLLLAVADDALGLAILAVFYPQSAIHAGWLLLPVAAVALGLFFRHLRLKRHGWYLVFPGAISMAGFALAGVHPALGLLPIIPTMPHAHSDLGLFMVNELERDDTLNEFEHRWAVPVEFILGLFGLLNAGVVLSAVGPLTGLVLAGLCIGKPLGILLFVWLAARVFGLGLPAGMDYRDLTIVGCAAALGFTVALFVSAVAFPDGAHQDAAKMGALLSFAAVPLTWGAAKALRIRKIP